MSIGALLKARTKPQQSKVSLSDPKPNQINRTETSPPSRKKLEHRTNKHAPMVMSSKRSVTRKRTVVEIPKLERRDPRFDSLSGAVDPELHQRSYGFLRSQRKAELDELRQAFMIAKKRKTSLPEEELRRMEDALKRAENAEVQHEKLEQEREALKKWKASEKVKQQEGKSAFYLKKKDQKDVILADRFEHLSQDKRKLQKAMERKRKKVAGKEKKSMPAKRSRT
ncbi:hypothetical protein CROQUDRAFT_663952 [Cronartium quercuum f. sp. fusiforme G11]|uniref:rRNA biogenesis protein RRP36 n=1 Tax=Cronartium quercuum f. sp. fusiforme G11 TaxID=708437 RepID=A0A9P6NCU3_9BASI|nr:hypothetical protein CROQUDRAFT_663952 [Cronartium quercuum f. sp. fusiforme G11]